MCFVNWGGNGLLAKVVAKNLRLFARLGKQTGQLPVMLIVVAVLLPTIQLNRFVK